MGGLSIDHPAHLIDLDSPLLAAVAHRVALSADRLEVIPAEGHIRCVDVLGSERYLVVYDLGSRVPASRETALAQTADMLEVCGAAILPCLGFVEGLCEGFHVLCHRCTKKPASAGRWLFGSQIDAKEDDEAYGQWTQIHPIWAIKEYHRVMKKRGPS